MGRCQCEKLHGDRVRQAEAPQDSPFSDWLWQLRRHNQSEIAWGPPSKFPSVGCLRELYPRRQPTEEDSWRAFVRQTSHERAAPICRVSGLSCAALQATHTMSSLKSKGFARNAVVPCGTHVCRCIVAVMITIVDLRQAAVGRGLELPLRI
jgi:hypothetical protein